MRKIILLHDQKYICFWVFWAHGLDLSSKQRYLWYHRGTKIWIFGEKMWEILKSFSRNILKPTTPSWSPHMKNLRNFYDFYMLFGDFGPFGHIVGVSRVNRCICGTPEVPKFKFFGEEMWKIFKSFSRNILGTPTPSWNPHMKKSRNFHDF